MRVLGIETTCDETAAAVVRAARRSGEILSNEVLSQIAEHAAYGGVVPEIAARAHVEIVDRSSVAALDRAGIRLDEAGRDRGGGRAGLDRRRHGRADDRQGARAGARKPFIAVNHLEGHALTARLTDGVRLPLPAAAGLGRPYPAPRA